VADEQPRGLTVNAVCLLAALALSLVFAGVLLTARQRAPEDGATVISAPRGPALQVEMAAAAVPALRPQPLPARRHTARPARRHARPPARRVVTVFVTPAPTPVVPKAKPRARATPRPAPPVRPVAPVRPIAPAPTAVPKPTATPEPSGEFDTTGVP